MRSTGFLFGFWRQIKSMFAAKRIIATLIYLAALVGTLVVAFVVGSRRRVQGLGVEERAPEQERKLWAHVACSECHGLHT
jgi:hypothetical protein